MMLPLPTIVLLPLKVWMKTLSDPITLAAVKALLSEKRLSAPALPDVTTSTPSGDVESWMSIATSSSSVYS
jgi:hypothetical protein